MPKLGYRYTKPSHLATLKENQVVKARKDYADGKTTQEELATRLSISVAAVNMLLKRRTYRWCGEKVA